MIVSFFEAKYPARDVRKSISEDEKIARVAYTILKEGSDPMNYYWLEVTAKQAGVKIPRLSKSARVNANRRSGMGWWVDVRITKKDYDVLRDFVEAIEMPVTEDFNPFPLG